MRLDENLSVTQYAKKSISTPDGIAWVVVCAASLLCLIDLYFGLGVIPLGYAAMPKKAAVLLIFTPIISFVFTVFFRSFSSNSRGFSAWFRVFFIVSTFIILNF